MVSAADKNGHTAVTMTGSTSVSRSQVAEFMNLYLAVRITLFLRSLGDSRNFGGKTN